MIAQICGKIIQIDDSCLTLDVNGICYEIFVPKAILGRIAASMTPDKTIRLLTYHYYQIEPSRSTPVLIGFLNSLEKSFFEQFISVSGIGPRAAIKALNKPVSVIAQAIHRGDMKFLTGLPGIGRQKAKDIVARLQDKIGRFALIQDRVEADAGKGHDLEAQALQVLEQLQYKKTEAKEMLRKVLERSPSISSVEDLLNEVYKQRREDG